MDDLIAFLRARLDEDAELARQAEQVGGAPSWDRTADVLLLPGLQTRRRLADRGVPDALQGAVEAHAARHDPARVLAEVDAKRRRLELLADAIRRGHDDYDIATELLPLEALPYVDHPDYRDTWRPYPQLSAPARTVGPSQQARLRHGCRSYSGPEPC
ncbi:DUF6221 family protein [Streptomyces sp. MSC1_001]|jgi:hypothetical protein|uniref:DUF6221 family protein n=1 Tax=Streptomyces sp. MSC1_001 TaxID=2909263 RepID=UPI00202F45AF|nr:DUF6221 family protein [Streptomyces sp. MSC1_001]